jgi:hypothetical protein
MTKSRIALSKINRSIWVRDDSQPLDFHRTLARIEPKKNTPGTPEAAAVRTSKVIVFRGASKENLRLARIFSRAIPLPLCVLPRIMLRTSAALRRRKAASVKADEHIKSPRSGLATGRYSVAMTEGIDWVRNEKGGIQHPLMKRASEIGMGMWHYCKERGGLGENCDHDLHEMIFQFQIAGAQIAGALDGLAYGEDDAREAGVIVAALKRALNYLHASLSAADKVAQKNCSPRTVSRCFERNC